MNQFFKSPCFFVITSWIMLSSVSFADIEHGSISVSTNYTGSVGSISLGTDTTTGVSFYGSSSNGGDYVLNFATANSSTSGVMIASVADNDREGLYATAQSAITSSSNEWFIPVFQVKASSSNTEMNINCNFAYFPHSEFLGGVATNSSNNGTLTATGSHDFTGKFSDSTSTTGAYTLDLSSITPEGSSLPATPANGILFVNGAKNESNYATSHPNSPDTFFWINCRDINLNSSENDPVAFVYIPFDTTSEQIIAMGRMTPSNIISTSAAPTGEHRGDFSLTKVPDTEGTWHLTITDQTPSTGTLIVSPKGGTLSNLNNMVSSQWVGDNTWQIVSRDTDTLTTEDLEDYATVFSFVFIKREPSIIYVDHSATTGENSGKNWSDAYLDLQSALEDANAYDQIWIAEGTYKPSQTSFSNDPRSATFQSISHVPLYGGFRQGGGLFENRKPNSYPTILSGDIGTVNDNSDNCYHVVVSGDDTTFDGLWIVSGNATSSSGGGIYNVRSTTTINACTFIGNHASRGGAINLLNGPLDPRFTFTYCRFYGNYANQGGIVRGYNVANGVSFEQCSLVDNATLASGGGAIASLEWDTILGFWGSLYFYNCSIFKTSERGYNHVYSMYLENCILYQQVPLSAYRGISYSHTMSSGDPLFLKLPSSGDGDWNTLADNDYGDLRLAYSSPAIDQGTGTQGATDLGGNLRKRDGNNDGSDTIDQGAYEFQPLVVVNTDDSGAGSLRQAALDVEDGGAIYFSSALPSGSEIDLLSQITLENTVRVDGSIQSEPVVLNAGGSSRIFHITDGDVQYNQEVSLINIHFENGNSSSGGAILNEESLSLNHSVFTQNTATYGGAFYMNSEGSADFSNCHFIGNTASEGAGAIYIKKAPTNISHCRFLANSAKNGGAIQLEGITSEIINTSFIGNSATDSGGAFYSGSDSSAVINCSFTRNDAGDFGSAIYFNYGTLVTNNSILWLNTSNDNLQISGSFTGNNNLIEEVAGASDPQFIKPPSPGDDSLWSGLDDNDYGDLRLGASSPAINAGDAAGQASSVNTTITDLQGNDRFNGIIDQGAYEGGFTSFAYLYPSLDPTDDANGNGRSNFLDYAMGGNPALHHDSSLSASLSGNLLTLTHRNPATSVDVFPIFQKSIDLIEWTPLTVGTDYAIDSASSTDSQTTQTLRLLINPVTDGNTFFRQEINNSENGL
ncbi:MAG: choice-of-anchor Q domain-containing protein [Opitutaceae bacterium]